MLYPSALADAKGGPFNFMSLSFSTTYQERGLHTGADGKTEEHLDKLDAVRPAADLDRRKTVPLVAREDTRALLAALAHPPPLSSLPVIGLDHRRVEDGLAALRAKGTVFVRERVPKTKATEEQKRALEAAWLRPYDEVAAPTVRGGS